MSPKLRAARSVAALVATAGLLAGCATGRGDLSEALSAWRLGRGEVALSQARAEYERFREGNGLTKVEVRAGAEAALLRLATTPVLPPGGPLGLSPTEAPSLLGHPALDLAPAEPPGRRPASAMSELRAALLGGGFTEATGAISVVMGLELRRRAPDLIALIYRRDPITDRDAEGAPAISPLLPSADLALQSLVAKRLALDALEVFSASEL